MSRQTLLDLAAEPRPPRRAGAGQGGLVKAPPAPADRAARGDRERCRACGHQRVDHDHGSGDCIQAGCRCDQMLGPAGPTRAPRERAGRS